MGDKGQKDKDKKVKQSKMKKEKKNKKKQDFVPWLFKRKNKQVRKEEIIIKAFSR